ncbi:MAG: mechanosensitive ion channel family protein [Rhodothalassiaceae bacterium]
MDAKSEFLTRLNHLLEQVEAWVASDLVSLATLGQVALLALILVLTLFLSRGATRLCQKLGGEVPVTAKLIPIIEPLFYPTIALLLVGTAQIVADGFALPSYVLRVTSSLLGAWLVIRLAVNLIASEALRQIVALTAWSIAALNILGLLGPVATLLDAARLDMGAMSISLLDVIKGALAFAILIWLSLLAARLIENRIEALRDVDASARELAKKLSRIALVTLALLIALNATGIDLTALAVFTGALGVGLGFGLQKVIANFVSGVILLMDRSIKPGDVIETQGTYGWINHLGARYTSIITRDGTEYLIPNEDMITQPVINWSFSDRRVRRKIPVSISYDSDLRRAMAIMEEVAREVPRVLRNPPPVARLMGFGDNGVDLELRLWIEDPQAGVVNVASDVKLAIWDRFHEEGIVFPYPQRVVHFAKDAEKAGTGTRP